MADYGYFGDEPISNTAETIDSREIMARIDYLEAQREEAYEVARGDFGDDSDPEDSFSEDDREELEALYSLRAEADGSPDWNYGETLIHDDYFVDYARELAEDIGAIDSAARWPYTCIDWVAAADALRQDYFSVEFSGETYWIRG